MTTRKATAIFAGHLIDGTGRPPIHDAAILIDAEGNIAYVGPRDRLPHEHFAIESRLEAGSDTLVPGLIDSHVHLTFNARSRADSPAVIEQLTSDDDAMLAIRAVQAAQSCLAVGITTVRDCGARGLVVLRLRDLIADQVIHGPRILACGMPITTTAGHCNWCGLRADNEAEVILATRRMVQAGADFVKVMATGGGMTPGSNLCEAQYSEAELSALVREAVRLGKRATAHSHSATGQLNCLQAGMHMIEHCNWHTPEGQMFDEALMQQLIDARTFIGITLSGPQQRAALESVPFERLDPALQQRYRILHRMREMHADLVLHSDAIAPITRYEHFPWSLVAAVDYGGFDPVEAIHAATGRAARAIGISEVTGTVEQGKKADLLIVEGNVAQDMRAITRPRQVIRNGAVVAGADWVRTSPSGVPGS
jgi:imidazolonepropionase-like amidohydrolase